MDMKNADLTTLTKSAYDAVKELEMGDEYKLEGFKILLQALLGGHQSAATKPAIDSINAKPGEAGQVADWQNTIASKMDIEPSDALEIYHLADDDQLELIIEAKDLPGTNSKSTQHIAALLSAGRQALGLEKSTTFDIIRKTCEHYRVYDSKNFSTYMGKLGSKFRFEGSSVNRSVELTNGAYKITSEIAKYYLEQK